MSTSASSKACSGDKKNKRRLNCGVLVLIDAVIPQDPPWLGVVSWCNGYRQTCVCSRLDTSYFFLFFFSVLPVGPCRREKPRHPSRILLRRQRGSQQRRSCFSVRLLHTLITKQWLLTQCCLLGVDFETRRGVLVVYALWFRDRWSRQRRRCFPDLPVWSCYCSLWLRFHSGYCRPDHG